MSLRRFFTGLLKRCIVLAELYCINHCAGQISTVAAGYNTHLLHHLTDDHFDVLVVDINTLLSVSSLHITQDVILNGLGSLNTEQIMRIDRTFCQRIAGFQYIACLKCFAVSDLQT